MATKVIIDGKTYCVETLLSEVKRLTKELTLQAEADKQSKIGMLTEIREKAWYRHSKYEDEKDFEVDKAVEDIVNHIDAKINSLKEAKDGENNY